MNQLPNPAQNSEFVHAAFEGDLESVRQMVAAGADVNCWDMGMSPLHAAIENGNVEVARFLLEHGADVNAVTPTGWTPLLHALDTELEFAENVHHSSPSSTMTELLLAYGASKYVASPSGETPYEMAKSRGHISAAELLR